jgi:hypothetical protein
MFSKACLFLLRDLGLGNNAAGKGSLDGDSERGGPVFIVYLVIVLLVLGIRLIGRLVVI